ncbi:hypothetical protein BY996DRAFT_7864588, partial [Phakopsora pachyrhizi]
TSSLGGKEGCLYRKLGYGQTMVIFNSYCPFLIDLWLNPICYVCFMPICGFIQFITAFVDQYVVVSNLLLFLMTHMWFYAPCIDISC